MNLVSLNQNKIKKNYIKSQLLTTSNSTHDIIHIKHVSVTPRKQTSGFPSAAKWLKKTYISFMAAAMYRVPLSQLSPFLCTERLYADTGHKKWG